MVFLIKPMNPVDKRNKTYIGSITGLAITITTISMVVNHYYLIALAAFAIFSFANTYQFKHRFILLAVVSIIGFPVLWLIQSNSLQNDFSNSPHLLENFFVNLFFAGIILVIPFVFVYFYLGLVIDTAIHEKKYYETFKNYPYLICRKHLTRTNEYSTLGYKSVRCRVGKQCTKKGDIMHSVKLIGLIGLIENGKSSGNDYYATLWDHRLRKIRYGDFDEIEIHENDEMKDYDFVLSKIMTFFYNEIDRYKPIDEVRVKIIGNPPIAENTKRILEKEFLSVEYISN